MNWLIQEGDILDIPADVLICSANPYLNLSGGVGGAFLLRYGDEMQRQLHDHLKQSQRKHVPQGSVVSMPSCGSPYRAVIHAIAVNALYESSVDVVASVVRKALTEAAAKCAKSVALPALATGYGKLSLQDFVEAIRRLTPLEFPPIDTVTIGVKSPDEARAIKTELGIGRG